VHGSSAERRLSRARATAVLGVLRATAVLGRVRDAALRVSVEWSLMAYSSKARELRRCRAIRKDGERCRAWAIWGHPQGLCASHAGVAAAARRGRSPLQSPLNLLHHARYPNCTCEAYPWPHRPGGGVCRWPDPPAQPPPWPHRPGGGVCRWPDPPAQPPPPVDEAVEEPPRYPVGVHHR
jgi:hypothetical protein